MKAVFKYLAGLAAFFPGVMTTFVYGFYAIYPLPTFPAGDVPSDATSPVEIFSKLLGPALPYCLAFAVLFAVSAAIVAGYIVHLFRGSRAEADKKWAWIIAMVFGAPMALPIYWHVHVWSPPGTGAAPMLLSRRAKLALGVGSLVTLLIAGAIFVASVFTVARAFSTAMTKSMAAPPKSGKMSRAERDRESQRMRNELSEAIDPGVHFAQRANFANAILRAALVTIFAIHAFRLPRLGKNPRVLWVLLLILFSRPVMPIYWYIYVWKDNGDLEPPSACAPPIAGANQ